MENLGFECIGRVGGWFFEWLKGGDSECIIVFVYFYCFLMSDVMLFMRCFLLGWVRCYFDVILFLGWFVCELWGGFVLIGFLFNYKIRWLIRYVEV